MNKKRYFIRNDLKRVFLSPGIYIACGISLFLLLRPLMGVMIQVISTKCRVYASFTQLLSIPFGTSDFTPFAAVFCVLPFAASFCEDYQSGYIHPVVTRVGAKFYARMRCITVMLSGGMMMTFTVGMVLLICKLLAGIPETDETAAFLANSIWWNMNVIVPYHGFFLIVGKLLLAFLFGCVWSMVGMTISVFFTNKFVVYIAPYVLYQILWFVLSETAFNPIYLLRGDSNFIPSFLFALIYQLAWIAVCALVFCVKIRRRIIL